MKKIKRHPITHLFTKRINSMKKIICTLLLLALATTISHAQIITQSFILTSQAEIDLFRTTNTEITGSLTINEAVDGNITNLNRLSVVTEIRGNLTIQSNNSLSSLSGLDALATIGGNIDISSNTALTSLNGLEMLNSIGGMLSIRENPALLDFCAISSLIGDANQITAGEYTVHTNSHNPSYATIQTSTACSVTATILTSQAAINGFTATEVTGNLVIEEATPGDITNLNALSTLTTIENTLRIRNNTALTSLSGLEMLNSIGGSLTLTGNPALLDFCAISSLIGDANQITVGEYTVHTNSHNPSYASIQTSTACSITETILTSQAAINGFTATEVTGNLVIEEATPGEITNLNALNTLTTIENNLRIRNNTALTSLSGLEMLDSIGDRLIITGNTALTDFCAISSLVGDANQITAGEYFVNTNSYNPPYAVIQNESLCSNADGGIFIGNLTLDTQDSIDAFRYRRIIGNLTIDDVSVGNITNLSGLRGLTNIGGYLWIRNNASLTSLSGLDSLTEIGGYLDITSNAPLTSLSGLESLTEIGEFLFIFSNGSLTSLSGLASLTDIGGNLDIRSNASLTSLSGLGSLTEIGGALFIRSNTSLPSLSGLEMLDSIGGSLTLTGNGVLTDFCAISSLVGDANQITSTEYTVNTNGYNPRYPNIQNGDLCSDAKVFVGDLTLNHQDSIDDFRYILITGNLTIDDAANGNITNLDSLRRLIELQGDLSIGNNDSLTSLSGLASFTDIGGNLTIQNNASLTSLSGLASFTDIGGNLTIQNNASLTSLSGLDSLTEIGGFLQILSNATLTSLSGLDSLTEIGGYLFISNNDTLTSLSGLASLTDIGGYLDIRSNRSLPSLSGLDSLTEIGGYLQIQSNDSLMSLSGLSSLTETGGFLQIQSNASLTSLSGLASLTEIGEDLAINTNPSLMSLSGLEMLDSIGRRLTITGNTALIDFCVISSLIGDDKQITSTEYILHTNGYNPPHSLIDDENYCSNADGGIFVGSLTLANQAAIETFNYRGITGNLTIQGSNITNLDSLESLTDIGGFLEIFSNNSLSSLSGLESLTEIGRYLFILNNDSLMSLSGLDSLTDIGGYLLIQTNASLTSLSGLASLTEIGGDFNILSNNSLTSFRGLESLTEIGGNLDIQAHETLTSLSGLASLTEIGGFLNISSNDSLTSLSGLESLTEIGGYLDIQNNRSLPSLSGLEMLESIGGRLTITGNTALTDFCVISSLIGDDKQITSGEYTLNTNGYNPPYTFTQNESLCSLSAGIFDGNLTVNTQDSIDDFRYRAITGNLIIDEAVANAITNLDGLNELTNIGGELRIQSNDSLVSLSGLELLASIGDTLAITGNPALTDFCSLSSLIGDDNQITMEKYTVNTNGYNPPYTIVGNETFCSNADGGIFVGDLTLANQAAINTFNYRGITGNLTIEGSSITNLDSLESLTEIGGFLYIFSNVSLTSLSGLASLTDIGGYLNIFFNDTLTSLSGLESLTEIGGYLNISSNPSLTSLSGLESLTEIGGYLNIFFNASLTSLSGLASLTEIGGNLSIQSNESLTSLSGLEMLDSIGDNLTLTSNTALTDFCVISSLIGDDKQITSGEYTVNTNSYNPPYTFVGTENFCSNLDGGIFEGNLRLTSQDSINAFRYRGITGNLIINDSINGNIKNLSGLSELIQVGGILQIDSNSFLTSLSGLESLIEIGRYLTINDNDSLVSLSGLESLHSTGDTLIVTGNRDLADFCTISSLIGDDKQITSGAYTVNTNGYNPSYTLISNETFCSNADGGIFVGELTVNNQVAIDTFNYRGITGNLTINDSINANITNLDGLASLTEIRGNLSIQSNESLTSLSGLELLDSIGGTLTITGNTALTNFCVISSLIGDDKQITSGEYIVQTNGYNPPYTEIQTTTRCSLDPPVVVADLPDVSIQPGDAFDPINLASAFSDPNRYALTYTATSSDETAVTVSIINDSTLTLVEVNGEGTATITVTATNDSVLSVSTTFTVSIILNLPPTVANSLMDVEIVSGTAFETIDFSAVFSDPESDVLTYTVATSDVAIVTATLNGTTLTLTETGKGTATITVTASDAFRSVEATFEVTITNTAPVVVANQLVTVSTQPGTPFAPIDLSTAFTDANGDELTYTATSSDETVVTVSVSGTTLTLTEVGGVGTATITVTATDGEASINGTFMAIISDNNAPIRTPLAFPEIPAVMVGYQLTPPVDLTPFFSDPDGDALTYTATTGDASIATVEIVQTSRMTFTAIGVGTTTLTVTATDPEGFSVTESVTIIVEEGALGIAETDILVVYPNPSSGVFELSRRATTVRVYDMNGRLVYRGRNTKQLDLTTHPSGQYLVEVGVGKERGRYTVIRE